MGTTTGDNLRYPELDEPGNVPQDMQELAADVQTALNKKMMVTPTSVTIVKFAGWANHEGIARKTGKLVVCSSFFGRSGALTVAAGTAYDIGTLPAGYRPATNEYFPCVWSDGTRRPGMCHVGTDGVIAWTPFQSANLVVDDWVSVSGLVFMTA